MLSNNQIGADNQQERQIGWVLGFVDGEGTFSVSINKNSTTSSGWQIFPEFVITQGLKSLSALKEIQQFFNCGKLYINKRRDNYKEDIYRYCVRSLKDLKETIIPFFQKYVLRTAKRDDFAKFVSIVKLIEQKKHLNKKGLTKIAKIIQTMNRKKPSRYLSSSETTCQAPLTRMEKI